MGGEFGEEDERLISRLENSQYDPAGMGHPGPPLEDPSLSVLGGPGGLIPPPSWTSPQGPPGSLPGDMELKRSPPS